MRQINALSSCANLTIVELNFATNLLDAWPLANCTKLKRVDLTGCRALPADYWCLSLCVVGLQGDADAALEILAKEKGLL